MSITANNDRLKGQRLIVFLIMGLLGLKGLKGGRRSENELGTEVKNTLIIINAINLKFMSP